MLGLVVPPYYVYRSVRQDVGEIVTPSARLRTAWGSVEDVYGNRATFTARSPGVDYHPHDRNEFLLISGRRTTSVPIARLNDPIVTTDGFAAVRRVNRADADPRAAVRFWTANGQPLRTAMLPWGVDPDYDARGVRAPGGVYVRERAGTDRFWWAVPGRATQVAGPGLVAIAPGGRRAVWWRGGRAIFAEVAGAGAAIRPGRTIWSGVAEGLPEVSFVPGGAIVRRALGRAVYGGVITDAGRFVSLGPGGPPDAVSPDGTLWRIRVPHPMFTAGSTAPSPDTRLWLEKRVRDRWVRTTTTFPRSVESVRFLFL